MQEDTFIKKFCESPLLISALSDADYHFYDFIGVLHILLVKNNKKKFHFSGGDLGNNLRVSKALKVPCKRIDRPFYRDKYQSNIIDESCLDHLVNTPIVEHSNDLCFSMNEKSITEQNKSSSKCSRNVPETYRKCSRNLQECMKNVGARMGSTVLAQ